MTTAPTTTAGERVEVTLHRLGYLIARHHLPEPEEWGGTGRGVHVRLKDLHDLTRWAEASDATLVPDSRYLHFACTVLGDVPLRMTCFGEETP